MKSYTSGYLTTDGFTTRYREYMDHADLPEDVIATDEEKAAYEDGDRDVYKTADGRIFLDWKKAEEHGKTLQMPELQETVEALEKVKILCDTYQSKSPLFAVIKDALNQITKDGGQQMLDKYYDSTCW